MFGVYVFAAIVIGMGLFMFGAIIYNIYNAIVATNSYKNHHEA